MHFRSFGFALLLVLGLVSAAQAHFVWVALERHADGSRTAHAYFSESPNPGEAHLVDRIAKTNVVFRSAGDKPLPLTLKAVKHEEHAELAGPIDSKSEGCLEATCKCGVFQRGGKSMLLHYYAKCLAASPQALQQFGRAESLPLDIVPRLRSAEIELEVLWQGKPAAASEVNIIDADGKSTKKTADKDGHVALGKLSAGTHAIRARWSEDKSGSEDGKSYEQTVHHTTLTLLVATEAPAAGSSRTAAQLLFAARDARAIWKDFAGFQADLVVNENGKKQRGEITVTSSGEVDLTGFELAKDSKVTPTLQSLVNHRLSNEGFKEQVSFADQQLDHPLGRLIRLDYDSRMASAYRVQDDVIREVNRQTGDRGRFTISVLDVYRNPEGKYLPSVYTVSSWNKDGTLQTSTAVRDTWLRVGTLDLPKTHLSVTTGKDVHKDLSLEFAHHKLLKPAAKSQAGR